MQKTLIYINAETKAQIDVSGSPVKKTSDMPTVERGQWQILCFQFMDVTTDDVGGVILTPHAFTSTAAYVLVADNDFRDDNSLMFKSCSSVIPFNESDVASNRMNIEGDWINGETADLSKGQISFRINADTEKFITCIGNSVTYSNTTYISIKQYEEQVSNPSSIAWLRFVATNTIRDYGEPTESPSEGSLLVPFVDSYLKRPFEFQFSVDSIEWHDVQAVDDRYYRQRISGLTTEWSVAIAFVTSTGGGGEGGGDQAVDIKIADSGNHFTATSVEGALAELAENINSLSDDFSSTLNEIANGLAEI